MAGVKSLKLNVMQVLLTTTTKPPAEPEDKALGVVTGSRDRDATRQPNVRKKSFQEVRMRFHVRGGQCSVWPENEIALVIYCTRI